MCDEGWSGDKCMTRLCDPRCLEHGQCQNGTCICAKGWNGKHCSLGKISAQLRSLHVDIFLCFQMDAFADAVVMVNAFVSDPRPPTSRFGPVFVTMATPVWTVVCHSSHSVATILITTKVEL